MKAYTNLEQSKKLAKILPFESADMYYMETSCNNYTIGVLRRLERDMLLKQAEYYKMFPRWSLASLLSILESEIDGEDGETYLLNIEKDGTWWDVWYREQYDEAEPIETESTEELIDACYKMIIKLHELNLL